MFNWIFIYAVIICFLMPHAIAQNNTFLLSGTVTDSKNVPLPSATIRIAGSMMGTVCDREGNYHLSVTVGSYKIIFSYIGYEPVTLHITISSDTTITVHLKQTEIRMQEIVVVGEDPALSIIRDALDRKKRQQKLIQTYKARVYTKDTFGTDTALGLISEAYSDLYWQKNDSTREVVVYRRQSSNLPKEFQFALVRNFVNFYDDSIRHWGYTFISPLADSTFRYYDFILRRTFIDRQQRFFEIEVAPKTQTQPLFSGKITIADSSFALMQVTLAPNNIFHIPFFEFKKFEFSQQYSLYDDQYWFPLEYRISAEMYLNYMLLKINQPMYYNKSVICYEYIANAEIDDSIAAIPSLTMLPSAQSYDTTQWTNIKVFPLNPLESNSYSIIEEKMKRMPPLLKMLTNLNEYKPYLDMADVRYNRVEGLFLGVKTSVDLFSVARIHAAAGFGIADEQEKISLQPEITLHPPILLRFGVEFFRDITSFPLNYSAREFLTTLSALFDGEDYYNYFGRRGYAPYISAEVFPSLKTKFQFISAREYSMFKHSDFSLAFIGTKKRFRKNPPVNDGQMRSFRFTAEWKNKVQEDVFFPEPSDSWEMFVEHTSKDLGSEFQFTSVYSEVSVRIPTMGTAMLFYPYIGIAASAGYSDGEIPLQRSFALQSAVMNIAAAHSFRTVSAHEFSGDNFYAAAVEYNFRNIPLLYLDITDWSIDIILRAAAGNVWTKTAGLRSFVHSTNGTYSEYTLGLGRFADVFRFDFSYAPESSRFAVSVLGSY